MRSRAQACDLVCVIHLYIYRTSGRIGEKAMATVEINVDSEIARLKRDMPLTYSLITQLAQPDQLGPKIFGLVRRGVRGERDAFYAAEPGGVIGCEVFRKMPRVYQAKQHMVFIAEVRGA